MEFFTNIFTISTRWWSGRVWHAVWSVFYTYLAVCTITPCIICAHGDPASKQDGNEMNKSKLRAEFFENGKRISDDTITGLYFKGVKPNYYSPVKGRLVKVQTAANQSENGCGLIDPNIVPKTGKWIALIKRGGCNFNDKIYYAAKKSNASAVVIYNDAENQNCNLDAEICLGYSSGSFNVSDVITVYVKHQSGQQLMRFLSTHEAVNMTISAVPATARPSTAKPSNGEAFTANNTSVLFVSISFIVLIIISLAWLVFYYIQRCRYTNAKERLSRRLANAAKKAIAKIPQRSVKYGDKELESEAEQCAVCIEPYKISDVIRVLPCRHVFHKSCVDPWLLEQRSCPMCKMDILRAFGMHLNGSQESVPQDPESGLMSSSPAIEEMERLSHSEDAGAVGGVKIVLYQHPAVHSRYSHAPGPAQYHDSEGSSEGSLDLGSSPVAQCHVECTSQVVLENNSAVSVSKDGTSESEPSLARSVSLDSVHDNSEDECNEIHSLISGLPTTRGSGGTPGSSAGAKSLRKSSGSSSISHSLKDSMEH